MSPSPHPLLAIWRVHTSAIARLTIPLCVYEWECKDIFQELIRNLSVPLEDKLSKRLSCFSSVEVPDFFLNATIYGNYEVSVNDQDNLIFVQGVCACDIDAGFSGEDCSASAIILLYNILCVVVFMWIGYLFIWVMTILVRGRLKSITKKKLACYALLQLASQMAWVSALDIFPFDGDRATLGRNNREQYGVLGTFLGVFLFMCGMTISVVEFVREGMKSTDHITKQRLKWLAKILHIVPLTMAVVFFPAYQYGYILLMFFAPGSVVILVSAAYSHCINLLDQRILRLLPREALIPKKKSKRNRLWAILYCLCGGGSGAYQSLRVNKVHVLPKRDSESAALLRTSRRLQGMAYAQSKCIRVLVLNVGVNVLADIFLWPRNEFPYASFFVLLILQVTSTMVPMVGLEGLSALLVSPAKSMRRIISSKQKQSEVPTKVQAYIESTNVGTLGS